jgi:hypothetical protein
MYRRLGKRMKKTWLIKSEFLKGKVKGRRILCYLLVDY